MFLARVAPVRLEGCYFSSFLFFTGANGEIFLLLDYEASNIGLALFGNFFGGGVPEERVDGFGNHDPGSGRYEQAKSDWDVVHKGRAWAEKCNGKPKSKAVILRSIERHLNGIG